MWDNPSLQRLFLPLHSSRGQITCSTDVVHSPPLNPAANMGSQKMDWDDRFSTFPLAARLEYTVFLRLFHYLYGFIPLSPFEWILHVGFSPLLVIEKIIITLAIQNHNLTLISENVWTGGLEALVMFFSAVSHFAYLFMCLLLGKTQQVNNLPYCCRATWHRKYVIGTERVLAPFPSFCKEVNSLGIPNIRRM